MAALSRPEEALDAGGDSTPLYHVPGGPGGHHALQDNIANISGQDHGLLTIFLHDISPRPLNCFSPRIIDFYYQGLVFNS